MSAQKSARVVEAGITEELLDDQRENVTLKMPELKGFPFETAVIERYRRGRAALKRLV